MSFLDLYKKNRPKNLSPNFYYDPLKTLEQIKESPYPIFSKQAYEQGELLEQERQEQGFMLVKIVTIGGITALLFIMYHNIKTPKKLKRTKLSQAKKHSSIYIEPIPCSLPLTLKK